MRETHYIKELELSLNNKCNLRCFECGFLIPSQPKPVLSDNVIQEHSKCLELLQQNGIIVGSLAILGGEPTLNANFLEAAIKSFSIFKNIKQIEIVTNGLNPKGLTTSTLNLIHRISVSIYINDKEFIESWKSFIARKAPHITLAFRLQKQWDKAIGDYRVTDEKAQKMFEECWYKKHCITIERSRLFLCSIAPKNKSDSDGLLLTESIRRQEIIAYLTRKDSLHHCKRCVPQMHIKKIQGGIQQAGVNLQKMMNNAKIYLNLVD